MKFTALTFLSIVSFAAQAQVQINEIMASNARSFPDVVDFEDYPDWIELKNTGGTVASLQNYFLSDDPANPYKWPFPASASIPANGHLMIMADGHDAIPGQPFLAVTGRGGILLLSATIPISVYQLQERRSR